MDQNIDDIEAWRRVHQQLTMAIVQSRDNIATELVKRRYLLEEMNRCKMQANTSLRSYAKKKAKTAPPPAAVEGNNTTILQAPTQGDVQKDVEQITDIALGSATYMYNQPPIGMSTAASEAMQLAFQMMEQMNQNKSKPTEESDNEEDTEDDDKTE